MFTSRARHLESRGTDSIGRRATVRGYTLIELLLVIALASILLTVSVFTFRGIRNGGLLAQAKNSVLTYSAIARSYAIENHIETMFVVNPYNGRFEIWHLNPPVQGGTWDPFSGGNADPFTDGYAYAPVLDKSAGLPVDGNGRPTAAVFPVDYDDPAYRPTADNEQNTDNMIWTALCYDENGRMVTRTRRIATRSYQYMSGLPRTPGRNRIVDEMPALSLREESPAQPLVTGADTAITSTRGFVICDWVKAQTVVGVAPSPLELVTRLLRETRPG